MAQTDISVKLLVLGATGFTGRLVTEYLYKHPERSSFHLALGARSKAKLAAVASELGLDDSVQRVQVNVTDFEEVEKAVKNFNVVVNTVGPFWSFGTNVVRACVQHGVHYVDITGETPWVRDILDVYDYAATKTRSVVIPSCGMDSIPSDLLVFLAARTLKAYLGPQATIAESTTAFKLKGAFSGGTLSTVVTILDEVPRTKLSAASKDWSLSPLKGVPGFRQKLLYTLPHSQPPVRGGPFIMRAANKAVVQRSWGLHELARRQGSPEVRSQALQLTYGPQFKYDEFMVTPNRFIAVLLGVVLSVSAMCLVQFKAARWLFRKVTPQSGEGPSKETQEKGFIEATNISISGPECPGTVVKTVFRGQGDPGYSLTAVMLSESALSLALNFTSLPALAREGGVLTPSSALGNVLVRRLEASGKVQIESKILEGQEVEGRKTR